MLSPNRSFFFLFFVLRPKGEGASRCGGGGRLPKKEGAMVHEGWEETISEIEKEKSETRPGKVNVDKAVGNKWVVVRNDEY